MDVSFRGTSFSGTTSDAKVFGYLPAILLNEYAQIETVTLSELDIDKTPDIYWFSVHRSILERFTGLSTEEQKEIESLLKYFGVLEISDDGEDKIKARINSKLITAIKFQPDFYLKEFKKAGIR